MEFWGVEIKAGESLKVNPGDDMILHLSQASLGEVKNKGNESVPLYVKIGGQKLVIGTLSPEKCTQITFDLVFEKEFELSHNWKNGSVYFIGYKSVLPDESEDFSDFGLDSEEEDIPLQATENGTLTQKKGPAKPAIEKANAAKLDSSAAKPKVKIAEPEKGDKSKEDDEDDTSDEEDDEDDSEEDESDDEDMLDAGDDSDEDDESSDEEDEKTPTPKKDKKRPSDSATKTPASNKKAKLTTPQKTDGKKGSGHTATPHPNKQAVKTPANSDKSKGQQTPKSGSQVSCKSCSKSFNSDNALQSHNKAKHSGGK